MTVKVMKSAIADMRNIRKYIADHNSEEVAAKIIFDIKAVIDSLREFPEPGNYLRELTGVGIYTYRELHYKPYRIIYSVEGNLVFVHIVADGRRDIQSLVMARLLKN